MFLLFFNAPRENAKSKNAIVDVIARAEDAAKIQRITERFQLATVDTATVMGSVTRKNELFPEKDIPVKDLKFDILTHPNIKLTQDGKAESFAHGDTPGADFTIELTSAMDNSDVELPADTGYELLSEADVEKLFND